MRWLLPLVAVLLLARCSSFSNYDVNDGHSPSSLQGTQGGEGVQTSIWSDDPSKKTLTNQHGQ